MAIEARKYLRKCDFEPEVIQSIKKSRRSVILKYVFSILFLMGSLFYLLFCTLFPTDIPVQKYGINNGYRIIQARLDYDGEIFWTKDSKRASVPAVQYFADADSFKPYDQFVVVVTEQDNKVVEIMKRADAYPENKTPFIIGIIALVVSFVTLCVISIRIGRRKDKAALLWGEYLEWYSKTTHAQPFNPQKSL